MYKETLYKWNNRTGPTFYGAIAYEDDQWGSKEEYVSRLLMSQGHRLADLRVVESDKEFSYAAGSFEDLMKTGRASK